MSLPTRGDWLVSKGYDRPGRGRPSADITAVLTKALESGVEFADWPPEKKVVKTKRGKEKVVTVRKEAPIGDTPEALYPPSTKITVKATGKPAKGVSLADVCKNSQFSLSHCYCNWYGLTHSAIIGSEGFAELTLTAPDDGE